MFESVQKGTCQTGNDETKDVQTMVPLKYLSNLRITLEMPLINCQINIFLTWFAEFMKLTGAIVNQEPKF